MDCLATLDALLSLEGADAQDAALTAHLAECAACAATARRFGTTVELLRGLPRVATPVDLAGRVVAALHAGYRQDRGVESVRQLTPLNAPDELEALVRSSLSRVKAPRVLERLVREDVEDESGTSFLKRFTNKLGRERAPQSLDSRVARSFGRQSALRPHHLAAAAILIAFAVWLPFGNETVRAHEGYSFNVVRVGSLDEANLDSGTRSMVEGLSTAGWGGSKR